MEEETRNVYVRVRLKVKPGVDVDTLMENLDYSFSDEENCIVDTEILGYGYRSFPEHL